MTDSLIERLRALRVKWRQFDPDEPSILGAGGYSATLPSKADAEVVWRKVYVDRMVERGVDRTDAQACCDAGEVDLSEDPSVAADDELSYWENDEP